MTVRTHFSEGSNVMLKCMVLLMEEIRRSPVRLVAYPIISQGFIHPRCKISAINKYHPENQHDRGKSTTNEDVSPTTNGCFFTCSVSFRGG